MATYYKPQSPIQSGEDFIYPITTADQIMKSDNSRRLEQAGLIVADNSTSLGGVAAKDYALKIDTAPNSEKLGNVAASEYALKIDTAPDSSKLGGTDASAYLKTEDADRKYAAKTRYGKAVFFGDSLSVGSSNNDYSFVDVLSESGMFESVTKCAYGGATIGPYSRYSDANDYCLINQITRYETDIQNANIVFLEYGANDYSAVLAGNVWPGFDTHSATDTTICGYLKSALNAIQAINPKARLVWLAFTRWHGGMSVGVEDRFDEDMLLYFEASVYRVVRSYHCGIIDITAEYKGDEFFASDGAHPNTEGHTLIAQNILSNLFKTSEYPRLFKQVNFAVASDGTVTADSDRQLIYVLLEAGAVDVFGMAEFEGSTERHPLRCVIYNSSSIVFLGNAYNDSYEQSVIEFSMTGSSVYYRKM